MSENGQTSALGVVDGSSTNMVLDPASLLLFEQAAQQVQQQVSELSSQHQAPFQQSSQTPTGETVHWQCLTQLEMPNNSDGVNNSELLGGVNKLGQDQQDQLDQQQNQSSSQDQQVAQDILPCCCYCGKPIADEYILRVLGEAWHAACLRCSDCGEQLQERCFVLNPLPNSSEMPQNLLPPLLCRRDFLKRSAARCPRCNQVLGEGDLVRKAQDFTFHAQCFACVACQRELITGQLFYVLSDSTLLCKFHYETAKERQNRILAEGAAALASSPSEAAAFFTMTSAITTGAWGESALQLLRGPVGLGALCGAGGCLGSSQQGSVNGADGPKRPRTTINSLQLELLRRAYETSSKPPRHIREQLSQETGLDMRVVQVWFQNKRAKEKRMRKDPSSSSVASNNGGGGSMSIFGGGHGNGDGSSTCSANFGRRRRGGRADDDDDSDADSDSMHSFDDDAPDDYVDD